MERWRDGGRERVVEGESDGEMEGRRERVMERWRDGGRERVMEGESDGEMEGRREGESYGGRE